MSDQVYVGTAQYNLIYIFAIHDAAHDGYLKIGETSFTSPSSYKQLSPNCDELNKYARARIDQYTKTALIEYDLLYTELARQQVKLQDGTIESRPFSDHDVHEVLDRSGFDNHKFHDSGKGSEWYKVSLSVAQAAIKAVKEGRNSLSAEEINVGQQESLFGDTPVCDPPRRKIILRDEQKACIDKTKKIFQKYDRMLWDCKMRFGKTITAYSLVKEMDYQKVLVVTHRPAVVDGWREDFKLIFDDNRCFVTKSNIKEGDRFTSEDASIDEENNRLLENLSSSNTPFVCFASMQDLRGSKLVGGKFDKNKAVFSMDWDIIIYDEAHEGTQTELGQNVQKLLEQSKAGKTPKKVLQLSGTPYNIINQYEDDNVYSWDYVMEQRAKAEWDEKHPGDHNPYADLPQMRICTFDLREKIKTSYRYEDENVAFNFKEFFRTWTGNPKHDFQQMPAGASIGDFVHKEDVQEFLNLISTESESSNYPFATQEYRNMFKHTFWILPGVKEARAFSALLKEHPVFSQYEVVNVAGEGDVEQPYDDALKAVRDAIKTHERTITLSCGKLTTGVTVKQWTGVMLLSGSANTGAAGYMQTIFRVQSAGSIDGKQKKVCYAFDFAPDRTLKVLSEVHQLKKSAVGTDDEGRVLLGEFLNFCPVLAEGDTGMEFYDVPKMMRQLKRLTVDAAIKSGFDDDSIYKADAGIVMDKAKIELFDSLKLKLTPQKKAKKEKSVTVNQQGLTDEEYKKAQDAKKKPKAERTEAEKRALEKEREQKKKRQALLDLLRNISIRLPLLIYGTATEFDESINLEDFIDIVDDESWKEFMPKEVDKRLFRKLLVFYDEDVVEGAGMRIRRMAKAADELMPTQRVLRIAEIFSYFRNPAKETVLTPWRVVNMHLGDTIGGYNFYKEGYPVKDGLLEEPELREQGEITADIFLNENVRVLEMNSKSGLYPLYMAYSIYRLLLPKPESEMTVSEAQTVWQKAIDEHLFVLCQTKMAVSITKRTLVGYTDMSINAIYLTKLLERMKNPKRLTHKLTNPATWGKEGERMKFNAIVGNPPYHADLGGASPLPIYHHFINQAKSIDPEYITMITPSRWFNTGSGLDSFREDMLNDDRISVLCDYPDATMCFSNVEIKGGIEYFLWESQRHGKCSITTHNEDGSILRSKRYLLEPGMKSFIRKSTFIPILEKVRLLKEPVISTQISSRDPFGYDIRLPGSMKIAPHKYSLEKSETNNIEFYYNGWRKEGLGYVSLDSVKENITIVDKYKVLVPKAWGTGKEATDWLNPFIAPPDSVCTETYLVMGSFDTKEMAENMISYTQTKFFHALVSILKISQNAAKGVYDLVPQQDYTKKWSDAELYEKYNLSEEEIRLIEEAIRPTSVSTKIKEGPVFTTIDDDVVRYYGEDGNDYDFSTVGSWCISFNSEAVADSICRAVISDQIVDACTRDIGTDGFIYFYVDGTSDASQRELIEWLLEKDLLPRNADGELQDIVFSYDIQTAPESMPDASLSDYVDLTTSVMK